MEKPHQNNLRKGRVSIAGQFYSITKCCHEKISLLIPDKSEEVAAKKIFEILSGSISWLNKQQHWKCLNFVMMPEHVHLIFKLGSKKSLAQVMHSFASFTAHEINKHLERSGPVWQSGYYDHTLRDQDAYNRHAKYIAKNPVRAGFVEEPKQWPFMKIEYLQR